MNYEILNKYFGLYEGDISKLENIAFKTILSGELERNGAEVAPVDELYSFIRTNKLTAWKKELEIIFYHLADKWNGVLDNHKRGVTYITEYDNELKKLKEFLGKMDHELFPDFTVKKIELSIGESEKKEDSILLSNKYLMQELKEFVRLFVRHIEKSQPVRSPDIKWEKTGKYHEQYCVKHLYAFYTFLKHETPFGEKTNNEIYAFIIDFTSLFGLKWTEISTFPLDYLKGRIDDAKKENKINS